MKLHTNQKASIWDHIYYKQDMNITNLIQINSLIVNNQFVQLSILRNG